MVPSPRASAKSKGLTAADLLVRYPELCPFLLARLHHATAPLATPRSGGGGEGAEGGERLHPELQPVLVLLAQVRRAPGHTHTVMLAPA